MLQLCQYRGHYRTRRGTSEGDRHEQQLSCQPAGQAVLGPGSLRSTTRTVSVVLSATALVALGAAATAPALASTVPSMNTVGNDTSIAVQGPNHSLRFY